MSVYGHREKLRVIGKEELLEPLNRNALAIDRRVGHNAPHRQAEPVNPGEVSRMREDTRWIWIQH